MKDLGSGGANVEILVCRKVYQLINERRYLPEFKRMIRKTHSRTPHK